MSIATSAAQATFPYIQVLTTIVGSGALAALATGGLQALERRGERTRSARVTALHAACLFEETARGMADAANSARTMDPHDDHGPPLVRIPVAPNLMDLDWKDVPAGLAGRAFAFQQDRAMAVDMVSAFFEHDDDDGLGEHCDQALRLGLSAWSIAADLRQRYGLPAGVSRVGEYDFIEWMKQETTDRAKRRAENLALADELFGTGQ